VPPDRPVAVRLRVLGAGGGLVRLCTDRGPVLEARLPADGPGTVDWTTTPAASAYVRAEVRRPGPGGRGAMVALTNPVLLGPAVNGPPPA
jgi:hypothetical protein